MSESGKRTTSSAVSYPARPLNMNGVPAPVSPMTYEQFLEWADEDTHAEWVNGEIEMPSPASKDHQKINKFLTRLISSFVDLFDLGESFFNPFQMKLPTSGREPDFIFLKKANLGRLHNTFIDGPADLVVEIISPESVIRDTQTKFTAYEAGGVREYWLINPMTQQAEFYQLEENNHYRQVQPVNGVYASRELTGFWLRIDWLWQVTPPRVNKVLLEISGRSYADQMLEELRQAGFDVQEKSDEKT